MPIGAETELEGMIDLITMKEWVWKGESPRRQLGHQDIRADLADKAAEMRAEMIEIAVEQDDEAMEKYLEGEEPDEATLRRLHPQGHAAMSFVPVLCGSAFKNKGVQPLLNAVIDYLPGPLDVPPYIKGFKPGDETETRDIERRADDDAAVRRAGLQDHERPVRRLADLHPHLFRADLVEAGDTILNSTKGKKRAHRPHADDALELPRGDRGSARRATSSRSPASRTPPGDTLCDPRSRSCSSDGVPRAGDRDRRRAEDQGRPGEDGRRAQRAGGEDPSFRVHTDRRAARPSSRAWASCTSTSSSTA
jgi:elongation factor G